MRNGMNISGFSEIVHEIQQEPAQAIFRYAAYAHCSPAAGMLAGVAPAVIGLLRAPRHFEVPIQPSPALHCHGLLDPAWPQELALAALSGCFLVSAVSGFSARRTTVDHLSMTTSAVLQEAGAAAPQVRYDIRSGTDKKISEALEVIEAVKTHSPNHQTFVQALGLSARLVDAEGAGPWQRFCPLDQAPRGLRSLRARPCPWIANGSMALSCGLISSTRIPGTCGAFPSTSPSSWRVSTGAPIPRNTC